MAEIKSVSKISPVENPQINKVRSKRYDQLAQLRRTVFRSIISDLLDQIYGIRSVQSDLSAMFIRCIRSDAFEHTAKMESKKSNHCIIRPIESKR